MQNPVQTLAAVALTASLTLVAIAPAQAVTASTFA